MFGSKGDEIKKKVKTTPKPQQADVATAAVGYEHAITNRLMKVEQIPLQKIKVNPQVRRHFDENAINDMADNIKDVGLIEPILVNKVDEDTYVLVAGERRFRAYKKLFNQSDAIDPLESEWWMIPAVVKKELSEKDVFLLQVSENIQNEKLLPIEEAEAFRDYMQQFGVTQEQTAKDFGKSDRKYIQRRLKLLSEPPEIIELMRTGMSHAEAKKQVEKFVGKKQKGTGSEESLGESGSDNETSVSLALPDVEKLLGRIEKDANKIISDGGTEDWKDLMRVLNQLLKSVKAHGKAEGEK